MFCSKCGTQLPDGAKFCTTCGNQLNIQPTAPMMPVEPVAPVMETPVMDAPVMDAPMMDAPVMDAPVMDAPIMDAPMMDAPIMDAPVMMETPVMDAPMMDTPIMPVAEPVMDAPAFNPAGQYPYNNVPNNMPYDMQNNMANNMPVNNGPKKSKAPLFIGIGIAVLVAIIVGIVLALVLSKDDDKKKNKSSKKPTSIVEETTVEEITEEETIVNADVDLEDAKDTVANFLRALDSSNYSKASKYVLPVILEIYDEEEGLSKDDVCELYALDFQDPNGELIDYEIYYSTNDDAYWFNTAKSDFSEDGYNFEDYSSFEEPTNYAIVYVDFTYEDQTPASVSFYLAMVDEKFYIFEYDAYDIGDIDFETESTDASEFDFETSLEENYYTINNTVDGTTQQFDGFTMTIPDDWTFDGDRYVSPDEESAVTPADCTSITADTKLLTLEMLCNTYIDMGFENLKFGNLSAYGKTGYFITGDYNDEFFYLMLFTNATEDKLFISVAETVDVNSDSFNDAVAIGASIEIQ